MNFFLSFLLSNFRKNMILPSPQLEILDPLLILTSGVKKLSEKLWPLSSIHEPPPSRKILVTALISAPIEIQEIDILEIEYSRN